VNNDIAPEHNSGSGRKPTRIQSVDRAARLLLLVASDPLAQWRVRTLTDAMKTSVPTMYHLLNTLVDTGLLTADDQGCYSLGIGIGKLANAYHEQALPPPELWVSLRSISEITGESVYLSAWRSGEMEVVAHLPGSLPVRVGDLRVGFHGVAHARAAGKVLLAFGSEQQRQRYLATAALERVTERTVSTQAALLQVLARTRDDSYAVEYEEFAEGVACLCVPILSQAGLMGAYTVSAPVDRLRAREAEYLDVLRTAAMAAAEQVDARTSATAVAEAEAENMLPASGRT